MRRKQKIPSFITVNGNSIISFYMNSKYWYFAFLLKLSFIETKVKKKNIFFYTFKILKCLTFIMTFCVNLYIHRMFEQLLHLERIRNSK